MGVNQRVKYVLRLPFLTKRAELKGKAVMDMEDDADHDDTDVEVYATPTFPYDEGDHIHVAVRTKELGLSSASASSSSSSFGCRDSRRTRLVRIASWASIKDHCRWTMDQERELVFAEGELARCQKAWSSEQELWLAYIKALHDEKEAHEDFLHHRAKQLGDEQQHFRKAWDRNRRRSSQEQQSPVSPSSPHPFPQPLTLAQRSDTGSSRLGRFRR
ncbi:hypothetical protein P175DRAFT_0436041 [Aspergillus ochraceoroseus IBT 24754]|uniref:Uncharacterized protein n=3 Tax=Aspergillus subgen. Nidulantes TaxID=2720870 RepID=A0A0F8UUW8_9EURO|nr:uncharacterized protein P175DRAFT_0436041 [Aspergillus ochraceoroseus IBT 24754]KKK23344.1 hypothetical protein ARAM_002146 [Aspergillus rambellii]PTU21465.1 hypothetical protein P175DRAFT_0436041 [Aspergillus ochraceoroseus IBT 24754]